MKLRNLLSVKAISLCFFLLPAAGAFSQDDVANEKDGEEKISGLSVSGSVDLYYKVDLASVSGVDGNISGGERYTFFAPDHNSFSIGMANVILEQSVGKSAFVADVSFGPRGGSSSIGVESPVDGSFHIQNLYVSHAITDAVSLSAGFMGTFLGYEVISPTGNFNYSTSHLFSWGPFQNAGVKLDFEVSERLSLMVGIFNDWNSYKDETVGKDIGLQLSYSISGASKVYLNFITGEETGTEVDIAAALQLTESFFLGVNAASYGAGNGSMFDQGDSGFLGMALYPQVQVSDRTTIGLRAEYFVEREINDIFLGNYAEPASVFSSTLSVNISAGPLTLIPEIRFDLSGKDIYLDSDGMASSSASQILLAAVYAF